MTEKEDLDLALFSRVLYPRHVVLVTCISKDGKANIIPLSFSMPVSYKPPIVTISVGVEKYSHKLLHETKEFVINVPTADLSEVTWFCGTVSGRDHDKFKEAKLTPLPAKKVKAPIIRECIAHLECKVVKEITIGDHTLFLGKVVAAYVNKNSFNYKEGFINFKRIKPLLAPIKKPR